MAYERRSPADRDATHAQGTSECSSATSACPANLLGEEGGGIIALMHTLPRERVAIGAMALVGAEAAFEETLEHCKQHHAFGRPIGQFQHNRFVLAEMATELAVARASAGAQYRSTRCARLPSGSSAPTVVQYSVPWMICPSRTE
jgi:alkylation response protein AidB-like acyl-CoA dehydrogenase